MADSEVFFPSRYAGRHNKHGSLPVKAATKYPKGTLVVRDANGRAARPAAGLHAHGISEGDFDNTSAGPSGNLGDDAFNVELAIGVGEFDYTGTAPKPGEKLYCVDNHTVSLDSSSGTRGIAGMCTEAGASGKVCVYVDPVLNGALAAGTASGGVLALSLSLTDDLLTDSDGSQSFTIGTLPANAVLLGASITVTEAFDDGAAGTFVADIGIEGGDTDCIIDGAADNLGTIGVVAAPLGVRPLGRYGAQTLAIVVNSNVNVVTATTGAALVEVFYAVV